MKASSHSFFLSGVSNAILRVSTPSLVLMFNWRKEAWLSSVACLSETLRKFILRWFYFTVVLLSPVSRGSQAKISVRHPTLCEDTAALLLDPLQKISNKYFSFKMLVTYIIVELFLNHFQSRRTLSSSFLDCLPWSEKHKLNQWPFASDTTISLRKICTFPSISTLQISTSERVRYIQSLCLHISKTVLRLLGLLINAAESENKCINHHSNYLTSRLHV